MALTQHQKEVLEEAIQSYAFPAAYYDFDRGMPTMELNMPEIERRIRSNLTSRASELEKNGLSNILWWGFAQMGGLSPVRMGIFRDTVTEAQLEAATHVFAEIARPSLAEIGALGLPQFSGVSFISKVRMFLRPEDSGTLDKQIMQIQEYCPDTVLSNVRYREGDTQIRMTRHNSDAYELWCDRLASIREVYFPSLRVVDIERGFFHLIQAQRAQIAAGILRDA